MLTDIKFLSTFGIISHQMNHLICHDSVKRKLYYFIYDLSQLLDTQSRDGHQSHVCYTVFPYSNLTNFTSHYWSNFYHLLQKIIINCKKDNPIHAGHLRLQRGDAASIMRTLEQFKLFDEHFFEQSS